LCYTGIKLLDFSRKDAKPQRKNKQITLRLCLCHEVEAIRASACFNKDDTAFFFKKKVAYRQGVSGQLVKPLLSAGGVNRLW